MVERCQKQLTFEGYRIRRIDQMFRELGVKHAKEYRRKLLPLFKDNIRPSASAEERLFDYVAFKVELKRK